jgi:hypothetical protein
VRLPTARIAPTSKVLACSQTGLEKSGANSRISGNSSAGNVSIRKTPFGEEIFRSLCGLPLLFQRPKMDKVELKHQALKKLPVINWLPTNDDQESLFGLLYVVREAMKIKLLCIIIASSGLACCYLVANKMRSDYKASQVGSRLLVDVTSTVQVPIQGKPESPCIAPDPLNPNWGEKEKQEWHREWLRRTRGYPYEITLAQAVDQFNKDAKCHEVVGSIQPPLTVNELLAAVRDIGHDDNNFSPSGINALKKIATEQIMPTGSLIWYDWGYAGAYELTYWKIYLYVELDKHPLDDRHDDNSITLNRNKKLVRLQYISSEPRRSK